MKLTELLKAIIKALKDSDTEFAIAGGLAANAYRSIPRQTYDIDFLVRRPQELEETAATILKNLGLQVTTLRQAQLEGGPAFAIKNKSTPVQVLVGRYKGTSDCEGADFLLPSINWVSQAVERAQKNRSSVLGVKNLPVMTIEDILIAKINAYTNRPSREKDLNDLLEIFTHNPVLDNEYLQNRVKELQLRIPKLLHQYLHFKILRQVKKLKR